MSNSGRGEGIHSGFYGDQQMKRYQVILGACAFFLALGLVGSMDVAEAEAQAKVYEKMVCAGHWPDYEGRKPKCP